MVILERGEVPVEKCPAPGDAGEHGLFETFKGERIDDTCVILALDRHLKRMESGAGKISVPCPEKSKILDGISNAVRQASGDVLKIQIIATCLSWFITAREWAPRFTSDKGASLYPIAISRLEPDIKTLSASSSREGQGAAEERGFDEALLIGKNGEVREGCWSNFFWIKNCGDVLTPKSAVLPGVTRSVLGDHLGEDLKFEDFLLKEVLSEGGEAFITNALHGVVSVSQIGSVEFSSSKSTSKIADAYRALYNENSSFLTRIPI